jgi:hypothetical protein
LSSMGVFVCDIYTRSVHTTDETDWIDLRLRGRDAFELGWLGK